MRSALMVMMLAGVCVAGMARAQDALELIERGNALAESGEWAQAEEAYRGAMEGEGAPLEAAYNLAIALREQGELDEARSLLRRVDSEARDRALAARARFNLGDVAFRRAEELVGEDPEAAIEELETASAMYRGALDLDPTIDGAAQNREIANREIASLREQMRMVEEMLEQMRERMQKLGEDLQEMEREQSREAGETGQEAQRQEAGEDASGEMRRQGQDQRGLRESAQEAQEELRDLQRMMGGEGPPNMREASRSLQEAQGAQREAEEALEEGRGRDAEAAQRRAAEKLREALENLSPPQEGGEGDQEQQQEQQEGEQGDEQQEGGQEGEQESQPQEQPQQEQQPGEEEQQQGAEGVEAPEGDAETLVEQILEKERREREAREEALRRASGGNQPVEKDW